MRRFSASGIGICGDRGEEVLHEPSDAVRDFGQSPSKHARRDGLQGASAAVIRDSATVGGHGHTPPLSAEQPRFQPVELLELEHHDHARADVELTRLDGHAWPPRPVPRAVHGREPAHSLELMLSTSPTLLPAAVAIASALLRASATASSIAFARAGAGSSMVNVGPLMLLAPAAFPA